MSSNDARCRVYREWKKEEESKKARGKLSKRAKKNERERKKSKRRDSEVEDDNKSESSNGESQVLAAEREKEKERRRENRKRLRRILSRPPSRADAILNLVQPSVDARRQFQNVQHNSCFQEVAVESNLAEVRDCERRRRAAAAAARRRPCQGEGKAAAPRRPRADPPGRSGAPADGDPEEKGGPRGKDKFWCKPLRRRRRRWTRRDEEVSSSSESECDSICSFDSEICLAGTGLTAEERKNIEEK